GPLHFPACRSRGSLWRIDGRAGDPARRRLREDQTGGAGRSAGCGGAAGCGAEPKTLSGETEMSDLDIEQKPSRRLWFFAGATALALHVGAALALFHLQADEADDALGAPAIEIGLEMMSPRVEATDLPPGPEANASVASPAQAEQKA